MTKLLGYRRDQLVGKELFEIGLLKDEAASQEMFRKLKRQREVRYEDLPLESLAGRHQEVEVVANLYQEDGHAVIQCNIRDITERNRAEATERRTERLALANLAANKEIARRRAVEAALRESSEAQRRLLQESQELHARVRSLAHQLISTQEEERKAISRDLHDSVLQTLVGINVELSVLSHVASAESPALQRKVARTQQVVTQAIDTVHRFARDLRPAVLDDFGLVPALRTFCETLAKRAKLKVQLIASAEIEALGSAERTALFRVAQEALTNVARHAHATRVTIRIIGNADAMRMEISDNGRSFPVARVLQDKHPKRLGLVNMRERVEMVGGTLVISSARGKGTTVLVDIPSARRR